MNLGVFAFWKEIDAFYYNTIIRKDMEPLRLLTAKGLVTPPGCLPGASLGSWRDEETRGHRPDLSPLLAGGGCPQASTPAHRWAPVPPLGSTGVWRRPVCGGRCPTLEAEGPQTVMGGPPPPHPPNKPDMGSRTQAWAQRSTA